MKRCNPKARAKCGYRKYCESDPMYAEGSICDEFSQKFDEEVITNADHIRAMTDEELAKCLAKLFADYTSMLYDGEYTPSDEAVCKITQELLRQLQQPHESEGTP